MDPAEKARRFEHRRQRLNELLDALWPAPRAWFAAQIGRSESYVARLLLPPDDPHRKNIGDAIMSAATTAFELDPGWFDQPMGSAVPKGLSFDDKGLLRRPLAVAEPRTPYTALSAESPPALSSNERRLLGAFELLPDDEQDDLLRDLERRAERYRLFAERLMAKREPGNPKGPASTAKFPLRREAQEIQGRERKPANKRSTKK